MWSSCTCVKSSESVKLSVSVVLWLRPHSGPRNFIYQERDRVPRRALFRKTHVLTINNREESGDGEETRVGRSGKGEEMHETQRTLN